MVNQTTENACRFPDASCGTWHVLLTKSRQEKVLAHELECLGIGHYLPLLRAVRYHGGRKAIVDLPMFTGYVFMRGMVEDTYRADQTRRVARIIGVFDQERLEDELRNIDLALSARKDLQPYPFLKNGIRVQVTGGPLKGLKGVVEDRKSNRLTLQVELLNSAASLDIDGSLLEAIE